MAIPYPVMTIITTVFNGEDYLESTINSVLSYASGVNFEYLVINDGSTDQTLEILEKFGNQIRVINQENIGESASVTKGFGLAKGEFVMVLSADDPLFTNEIFKNVFELFAADENLVAVYPDWNLIDSNGEILKKIYVPDYSDELLIGRFRTLPGPGVIIRRSAALKIGGRRSKWVYVGDYDFWLRLSRIGELRHRPEILAQWREHPNSTSVKRKNFEMASERIAVIEDFTNEFKIDGKLKKMALGNAYYMAARLSYFDPTIPGRKWMIKSLKLRKWLPEESKFIHVLFLLTFPLSYKLSKLIRKL
jgi:glycosyltransferase involved in cell wall biosynthesis